MENDRFQIRFDNENNMTPIRLLFFILIITMILSLVVSYVVINFSGFNNKGFDSGRIIVDVVDGKSEKLFSMAGKIVVDVVDSNVGEGNE